MIRFTRGRRRSSVVLGAAVVALAFGVSVGLAKSGPSQYSHLKLLADTLPVAACPPPVTGKDPHSFGEASLQRSKGTFKVTVHLRGAAPGKYDIVLGLFDPIGLFCTTYGPIGLASFNVDSSGDGNGTGKFVDDIIPAGGFFVVGAFRDDLSAAYVSNPVKLGST